MAPHVVSAPALGLAVLSLLSLCSANSASQDSLPLSLRLRGALFPSLQSIPSSLSWRSFLPELTSHALPRCHGGACATSATSHGTAPQAEAQRIARDEKGPRVVSKDALWVCQDEECMKSMHSARGTLLLKLLDVPQDHGAKKEQKQGQEQEQEQGQGQMKETQAEGGPRSMSEDAIWGCRSSDCMELIHKARRTSLLASPQEASNEASSQPQVVQSSVDLGCGAPECSQALKRLRGIQLRELGGGNSDSKSEGVEEGPLVVRHLKELKFAFASTLLGDKPDTSVEESTDIFKLTASSPPPPSSGGAQEGTGLLELLNLPPLSALSQASLSTGRPDNTTGGLSSLGGAINPEP